MSSANSNSPPEVEGDCFNDLSRGLSNGFQNTSVSPPPNVQSAATGALVPRPKRIACVVCRKRKLRCDGSKPSCGTCARLQHDCAYDEVRRRSGPKRGYVKQLETRLARMEALLKTQEPNDPTADNQTSSTAYPGPNQSSLTGQTGYGIVDNPAAFSLAGAGNSRGDPFDPSQVFDGTPRQTLEALSLNGGVGGGIGEDDPMMWELIALGIEEPLPPQEVMDELYQIYFEKIHPSVPMIHRRRFLAAMNLGPQLRPPIALRYAMWCLAASVTDKYLDLQQHFYQRARKYAEADEMKGHGEHMISIAHAQCWTLLATYEFKLMYFPRAWMSTGRGIRLAQMMGLHRLDGVGLDVKQCLPPPRDWTEREERRRTFWLAFCSDRYASIGTGWPMLIEERDISTNLPASEEAFEENKPQRTLTLKQAMTPSGASSLAAFAGVILMASLFGHNLIHLHRPDPNDNDDDMHGEFWRRHRKMDAILSNTSLSLPAHLRLPAGMRNANIVFLNMNIHTSTICLHQAAIFKADKNRLPASVSQESKVRCITAAAEIASIMRTISHLDLSCMNPFISFCLYVAARVFVQYIKSRPEDEQVRASLRFLLQAMQVLKKKNPLTESFLVQLEVDLDGTGMDNPDNTSRFAHGLNKGVAELPRYDVADGSPHVEIQDEGTAAFIPSYSTHPNGSRSNFTDQPEILRYQAQNESNWSSPDDPLVLPTRQSAPVHHYGATVCGHNAQEGHTVTGIVIGNTSMDPGHSLFGGPPASSVLEFEQHQLSSHGHPRNGNNGKANTRDSMTNNCSNMDLTPDTTSYGEATNRSSPSTMSNTSRSGASSGTSYPAPPSSTQDRPHPITANNSTGCSSLTASHTTEWNPGALFLPIKQHTDFFAPSSHSKPLDEPPSFAISTTWHLHNDELSLSKTDARISDRVMSSDLRMSSADIIGPDSLLANMMELGDLASWGEASMPMGAAAGLSTGIAMGTPSGAGRSAARDGAR